MIYMLASLITFIVNIQRNQGENCTTCNAKSKSGMTKKIIKVVTIMIGTLKFNEIVLALFTLSPKLFLLMILK